MSTSLVQDCWGGWYDSLLEEEKFKFVGNDNEDFIYYGIGNSNCYDPHEQQHAREISNQRKRYALKKQKLQRQATYPVSQDGMRLAERYSKPTNKKLSKKTTPNGKSSVRCLRSNPVREECQRLNQLAKSGQLDDEIYPQDVDDPED